VADAGVEVFASGEDEAALAAGAVVLAEHGGEGGEVAEGAERLAVERREMGLGAVLDHGDAVLACEGHDAGHVDGLAADVGDHDGAGQRRDQLRDRLGAGVVAAGLGVGDDGDAAQQRDGHHAARVRDGADDDLGEGLEAERSEGAVEGGRARVDGVGEAAAEALGECLAVGLLGRPVVAWSAARRNGLVEEGDDRVALLGADQRAGGPRLGTRLRPAVDRELRVA